MEDTFFRFPRTPHLALRGSAMPRDDKVLSSEDAIELLSDIVTVEEKVDGANIGISRAVDGHWRVQNRGEYLRRPYSGQFSRLSTWLAEHGLALTERLGSDLVAFGEWCAAKHSVRYDRLPDWFLLFDIYDRRERYFWSTSRRNRLAAAIGCATVPEIGHGQYSMALLEQMLGRPSQIGSAGMEGLIIRRETAERLVARAKLVRSEFVQQIGQHWRDRPIEWNASRKSHSV